jgi:hypothetical protein
MDQSLSYAAEVRFEDTVLGNDGGFQKRTIARFIDLASRIRERVLKFVVTSTVTLGFVIGGGSDAFRKPQLELAT